MIDATIFNKHFSANSMLSELRGCSFCTGCSNLLTSCSNAGYKPETEDYFLGKILWSFEDYINKDLLRNRIKEMLEKKRPRNNRYSKCTKCSLDDGICSGEKCETQSRIQLIRMLNLTKKDFGIKVEGI